MTEYRKNKTTGNHRWIAVLLAVLTVFSALPGRDFYISARAEEQSADQEESAEAALEGIRLEDVPEGMYLLCAAPLNLGRAEGAPCRAVLLQLDET